MATILAGGLISAVIGLSWVKTREYDATRYFEGVAVLRHLEQVDAKRELDALRSKVGLNSNYDPLADPLQDIGALGQQLGDLLSGRSESDQSAFAQRQAAARDAIERKSRLIERFKTYNSVLRNSLGYLPTAADDVHSAAVRLAPGADRIPDEVDEILLSVLLYDHAASAELANDILARLKQLDASRGGLPPDLDQAIVLFGAHARAAVRERARVAEQLIAIDAVPVAALVDDLRGLLAADERRAADTAQRYRTFVLLLAVALALLLFVTATKLFRSYAEIRRVNDQLRAANELLELRVDERTRELRDAQGKLLTAARQAGMAEIASNVLHNVGNVLNSVNVSANVVSDRIRASKGPGLARAVALLKDNAHDLGRYLESDERGRLLPGYLDQLAGSLQDDQRATIEELGALRRNIEHIREIVTRQQSYASASAVTETLDIRQVLNDCVRIDSGSSTRAGLAVRCDYDEVDPIEIDKHKLLQIVVNLLGNARQACEASTGTEPQVCLRLSREPDLLRISVADNGVGIPAENLTRIFNHGFTTKSGGHGFGLHSCALAAKALGGALSATSDGPGKGATFALTLPLRVPGGRVQERVAA